MACSMEMMGSLVALGVIIGVLFALAVEWVSMWELRRRLKADYQRRVKEHVDLLQQQQVEFHRLTTQCLGQNQPLAATYSVMPPTQTGPVGSTERAEELEREPQRDVAWWREKREREQWVRERAQGQRREWSSGEGDKDK